MSDTLQIVSASGSSQTVDVSVATVWDITLTADCTLSLTGASLGEADTVALLLRQDGTGGWNVTWPGSVVWPAGAAPTLHAGAGDVTLVTLTTVDGGTTWIGFAEPSDGADGATGAAGADGTDGVGVPAGGSTGQVLTKASATDYDTEWADDTDTGGSAAKLYDFTVTGSDKASIDTAVDGTTVANFAGYDVLEIFVIARTDDAGAGSVVDLILNNDTSSIYDRQAVTGNSATASASGGNGEASWRLSAHGSGGSASYPAVQRLTIPGYAATTFWKVAEGVIALPDATAANAQAQARSLGYRSTSAITRVKLAAEGTAKLKVGSRLLIYGR